MELGGGESGREEGDLNSTSRSVLDLSLTFCFHIEEDCLLPICLSMV